MESVLFGRDLASLGELVAFGDQQVHARGQGDPVELAAAREVRERVTPSSPTNALLEVERYGDRAGGWWRSSVICPREAEQPKGRRIEVLSHPLRQFVVVDRQPFG